MMIHFLYFLAYIIENTDNRKVYLLDKLPNTAFTSSNSLNSSTLAHHSKLRSTQPDAIGWFPGKTTADQWIQVDLAFPRIIREIHVAPPRNAASQYVKEFEVLCSLDGTKMKRLGSFNGSAEASFATVRPAYCRFVRIVPKTFEQEIALRWELVQTTGMYRNLLGKRPS